MGSRNVLSAAIAYADDLSPAAYKVLMTMAALSHDEHAQPVYYGGWERLAIAIGGRPRAVVLSSVTDATARRRARVKVTDAVGELIRAQIARPVHAHAHAGLRQHYELAVGLALPVDKLRWDLVVAPLSGDPVAPLSGDPVAPLSGDPVAPLSGDPYYRELQGTPKLTTPGDLSGGMAQGRWRPVDNRRPGPGQPPLTAPVDGDGNAMDCADGHQTRHPWCPRCREAWPYDGPAELAGQTRLGTGAG